MRYDDEVRSNSRAHVLSAAQTPGPSVGQDVCQRVTSDTTRIGYGCSLVLGGILPEQAPPVGQCLGGGSLDTCGDNVPGAPAHPASHMPGAQRHAACFHSALPARSKR
jgi:hypothetical protein